MLRDPSAILIAAGAALFAFAVARVVQVEVGRRREERDFVEQLTPKEQPVPREEEAALQPFKSKGLAPALLDELNRAGWRIRPSDFVALSALSAATGLIIGYAITKSIALGVAFAFLFSVLPWLVMKWREQKRIGMFQSQLPDTLFLIASAVRNGFAFQRAVEVAAEEMPDPMKEELHQVLVDCRVGIGEAEALWRLRGRVGLPEIDLIAAGVGLSLQSGGNLSPVLDTIAEAVRERTRVAGEIRAITSEGRASAIILVAAPLVLLLILSLINPGYMHPLIREPVGHILLGAMLASEVIGALVIRRLLLKRLGQI